MNTLTSQTVSVADSTDVADNEVSVSIFERALGTFTGDGVGSIFRGIPELERLVLTEMVARLESTIEVNGVTFTVSQARNAFRALHVQGIKVGKRTCEQLPTWAKKSDAPETEYVETVIDEEVYDIFTVDRGYIDVKSNAEGVRDYAGVPCLLREADSRLYEVIDEFIGELGMGRSRRGNKGYWSEYDLDELVAEMKERLAEIS